VGVAGPVETGKSQQVPILKFLDTQNQDGSYTYGYEVRILEWSSHTYRYEVRILEWSSYTHGYEVRVQDGPAPTDMMREFWNGPLTPIRI
jgi:hypothetical protein